MILNNNSACAAIAIATVKVVHFRPLFKPLCLFSTEQLRDELTHLHSEADITRAKANNARLRLLRLSEAAEKLRRQAAISVRTGKENDARDLLFQKKKVVQALEKSKSRIKLFDDLSAKLNEAIDLKESQLIGNIGLDLAMTGEDTSSPVRIVSPEQEAAEDSGETDTESVDTKLADYQDLQPNGGDHASMANNRDQVALSSFELRAEDEIFRGTSSYEGFMENLDNQLSAIEDELITFLRVSTVVLDGEDKQKNLRLRQIVELLDGIRLIRKRLSSFKLTNVNTTDDSQGLASNS